jgi:putative transposase
MRKKYLALSSADEKYLKSIVSKGQLPARVFKRAMALLQLQPCNILRAAAEALNVTHQPVAVWYDNYLSNGLKTLNEKHRTGRPVIIDDKSRATNTALACSTQPEGHARWTLRLLADKAVEPGIL